MNRPRNDFSCRRVIAFPKNRRPSGRDRNEEDEMVSRDFIRQLQGYGLTTAEISYYMPDHPALIQLFI